MFETGDPRPPPGRPGSGPRRPLKSRGSSKAGSAPGEAFLERREPTVELEDLASADLHESVHESPLQPARHSTASASMLSRSNGDAGTFALTNKDPDTFGKTTATTELMDQLSALRKRLEGEQSRVDKQIKSGSAQYSKLAYQSRRRKEQQIRVDDADDVVGQVLAQLKDVQVDVGGSLPGGDAPTGQETGTISALFIAEGTEGVPLPDEGMLNAFNKIKYSRTEGTDGAPSAQTALIHAFPEPPASDGALDTQQRALIQAQERELELLRGRLGTTLDRNGTLASLASTGSFNLDIVTAKNEERLRRLNATASVQPGSTTSHDILESFLNESAVRGLGGSTFAPGDLVVGSGELHAESIYRQRD